MIQRMLALAAATFAARVAVIPVLREHANAPRRPAAEVTTGERSAAHNDSLSDATSSLMPVPRSVRWDTGRLQLDAASRIAITGTGNDRLRRGVQRFHTRLARRLGVALTPVTVKHAD